MPGEFFMPQGFHDRDNVTIKRDVGVAALAAELASDNPHQGRVAALREYVERYDERVTREAQRHKEVVAESQYLESED